MRAARTRATHVVPTRVSVLELAWSAPACDVLSVVCGLCGVVRRFDTVCDMCRVCGMCLA